MDQIRLISLIRSAFFSSELISSIILIDLYEHFGRWILWNRHVLFTFRDGHQPGGPRMHPGTQRAHQRLWQRKKWSGIRESWSPPLSLTDLQILTEPEFHCIEKIKVGNLILIFPWSLIPILLRPFPPLIWPQVGWPAPPPGMPMWWPCWTLRWPFLAGWRSSTYVAIKFKIKKENKFSKTPSATSICASVRWCLNFGFIFTLYPLISWGYHLHCLWFLTWFLFWLLSKWSSP